MASHSGHVRSSMESLSLETIVGQVIDGFEILERFSSGAFSVVHFAKHLETGNYCAAKIVHLDPENKRKFSYQMREISVLTQVCHKHIVTLYRLSVVSDLLIFFLEYAPNGTLLKLIHTRGGLPEVECRLLFFQLFSAVRHLHRHHFIVHRDLKLENCLIDANGNVKLADFGLCDTFYCKTPRGLAGSPGYTAPEVLVGGEYTEKCDIFSLGVCLFALRTGRLPFKITERVETLVQDIRGKTYDNFSPQMADLISRMVEPQASSRYGIDDIQRHPWMLGVPEMGTVVPSPVVFYIVNGLSDIKKFRRRNVAIVARAAEETAKFLGIEREELEAEILSGMNSDRVAIYLLKLCPYTERPQLPKLPGLPQLVQKKPRPPVTVRLPRTPKRFTVGAPQRRVSPIIRRSQSDPESIENAKKSPVRNLLVK